MEQCNRELIWQNRHTGEIISRWVTAEKPYYSNLNETSVLTISNREYKVQVTYDEETSLIDVDKRFMLEIVGDNPRTYKVSSVDTITERFYEDGIIRGFLVLNLTQDLYNPNTDNKELMICDYISPEDIESQSKPPSGSLDISFSGSPSIRYGGSAKKFTAVYSEDGTQSNDFSVEWGVTVDLAVQGLITYVVDGPTIRLQAADDVTLLGHSILLSARVGDITAELNVEVID